MPEASSTQRPVLSNTTVWLLSAVGALAVANLYYSQPLLADIARYFRVPASRVGIVSTLTQVGYAVGILLFVPLSDVRERRGLIVVMLGAVAVALTGVALAPSLGWLAAASFAMGATTVVPQLIVPFAAGLAAPGSRGRVVGLVMSGILIGVLGARTVSGVVGSALGWRAMFGLAAGLMLALSLWAGRRLPHAPPAASLRYGQLLRSLLPLARGEPVLREAAILAGLGFAAFSAFWTTLVFRLETPPLHYGARTAGGFGLVGIVGALTAPFVGRLSERRSPRTTVGVGIGVGIAAYLCFFLAGSTLAGLVVGVILLDAGAQTTGVSNQARIYGLPAELHGRLNTVYMVAYFVGGALGSLLGAWAWGRWGWEGVCGVGLGMLLAALGVYLAGSRKLTA
ncbi:MAG: MFS transporter [Gemmatimonadetes bacterium]|nr:MFS transporter [Gemmatimonadota bacterium]